MGLIATMLGQRLAEEARHALLKATRQRRPQNAQPVPRPALVPGPPPPTQWNSSAAPLPELTLVNAGMRPITGGRRSSF